MAPSRLRKAIGAVKDQTSIGLAKIGRSSSLSDLEVAIVKATRHHDDPPDERHVSEIISLTSYSRALVNACVGTIARRLDKTRNWVVALKSLMLVQRLLSEGDPAYEPEVFFATRGGTRLLNMSDFRDASGKVDAWDYSAFVRTYAMYLDENLEFRMQGRRGKRGGGGGYSSYHGDEEEDGVYGGAAAAESKVATATPVREMKKEGLFCRVHHLVQLLERFLACRPAGAAKHHRIVAMAVYYIVKESIQLHDDITETTGVLLDRFMQLEIPDMVRVYEIFCRLSKQYDELDAFYDWCKIVGIIRFSEYPYVEKIPQKKLDVMDDLIHQKSAMSQYRKRATSVEPKPKPVEEVKPQEDLFKIKALPPCEGFAAEQEEKKPKEEKKKVQDEGDLLNLGENAPSTEEQVNKLALALFDSGLATAAPTSTTPPWEAFKDSSGDWETALVESVSHLSNQKASLAGGLDTLTLDGMYQHGAITQAVSYSSLTSGSASSVALGSAGRPAMLALPAPPPVANGGAQLDPFAASLAIEPPSYVQMSEMEKKQRFLVQEQLMWQQYGRNGMYGQGQERIPYQYNRGGYGHI